jgi:hypothetical protein
LDEKFFRLPSERRQQSLKPLLKAVIAIVLLFIGLYAWDVAAKFEYRSTPDGHEVIVSGQAKRQFGR